MFYAFYIVPFQRKKYKNVMIYIKRLIIIETSMIEI